MASGQNDSNASTLRGLHNTSVNSLHTISSTGIHYTNPILTHHVAHSHSSSGSPNLPLSTSSNVSSLSSTSVSLPAPAPVPSKSTSFKSTPTDIHHSITPKHSGSSSSRNPDQMLSLMAKLWFDHNLESSLSTLEKEEHEKRMKDLRKQMEYVNDTNWKYASIDKYIGQL